MLCLLTLLAIGAQVVTSVPSTSGIDASSTAVIGNQTYYFSALAETLLDAMAVCADLDMSLVNLETEEEFNAPPLKNHWTSGMKVLSSYMWSGVGKQAGYMNWNPGFPQITDSSTQSYVYLYDGKMSDATDVMVAYYICEQREPCKSCAK
ncbi:hypothetical protein B566_EDAN009611 [Ephemera danica]|nr:hypothetical protein B566_EDAN009611 [Ephemera danica]